MRITARTAPAATRASGSNQPRWAARTRNIATPAMVMTAPAMASTRVTAPSRRYHGTAGGGCCHGPWGGAAGAGVAAGGWRIAGGCGAGACAVSDGAVSGGAVSDGAAGAAGEPAGRATEGEQTGAGRAASGMPYPLLALEPAAQAGQAVADGVHAGHRLGELCFELLDLGAGAHGHSLVHQRQARLSTPTHSGQGEVVVGLAARVVLTSIVLPSRRTVRVTSSPAAALADVGDEGQGRLDPLATHGRHDVADLEPGLGGGGVGTDRGDLGAGARGRAVGGRAVLRGHPEVGRARPCPWR